MATDRPKKGKTISNRAEDFLGAVVPLRAPESSPASSKDADLSNVIPITSRRRIGPDKRIPELIVSGDDRPAPWATRIKRRHIAMFLIGSAIVHAAIFVAFNRPPPPLASVGEVSISVELVLGTDRVAGRSSTRSESEVSSPAAPTKNEPIAKQTESPRKATETAEREQTKEPEKPVAQTAQPSATPPMSAAVSSEPAAELPLPAKEPARDATKPVTDEKPKPVENRPDTAPAKKRAKETGDGQSERKRAAPASAPSVASNSIGIGRSDASTNYRGIVSAHLARFKQFPADARANNQQGAATVSFSLDGGGRVTSVRLARGSGISSIDQETQAMVRRASPFPAPPDGRGQSFTVPVSFYLR